MLLSKKTTQNPPTETVKPKVQELPSPPQQAVPSLEGTNTVDAGVELSARPVESTKSAVSDNDIFGTGAINTSKELKRRILSTALVPVVLVMILIALFAGWQASQRTEDAPEQVVERETPVNILDVTRLPQLTLLEERNDVTEVVFNNTIVSNGALVLSPNLQPTESVAGQVYYDEATEEIRLFTGNSYESLVSIQDGQVVCFVGSDCGFLTVDDIPSGVTLPQPLGVTDSPTFAGLTITNDLQVSSGGTGASSFANNTVLIGNGTGAITTTNAPSSGQLLVSNAAGLPQFVTATGDVTITSTGVTDISSSGVSPGVYGDASRYPIITVGADGRVTSVSNQVAPGAGGSVSSVNTLVGALTLQGTTNQISAVSGGTTITLSTPQDIAATSSPTFNGLTVSSITRGVDTITDFTGAGLQVTAGALETTLGTSIDSSEIENATILFGDLSQNGCGNNDIIKWNGAAWICSTDAVGSGTNTFATIATPLGTSPVADSTTDTLTLAAGSGVTITGDSATDTITLAAVLGTDIDLTSEVTGTLPVANGGTGSSNAQGAIDNISGLTTNGDLLYFNGTNSARLARGATGQCLTSNATTLEWTSCAGSGTTFFMLAGSSGTPQGINGGDTATIAAGASGNLTSVAGATDTVTIDIINSPTFTGLVTLNGGLSVEAGDTFTFNGDAFTDLTGTGLSFSGGSLVTTLGTSVDLTSEVINALAIANGGTGATTAAGARGNLSAAASGANADITSTTALNIITPSTALTVGATGQSFTLQGSAASSITATDSGNTTTVGFVTPTANVTLNYPALAAGTYQLCTTSGNCLGGGGGGANTALSNLTSVAINTSLLPGAATIDLGSGANPFRDAYLSSTIIFEGSSADANETVLSVVDPTADVTYRLPDAAAGTYDICTTDGNCIGGGGGSAPSSADYVTLSSNASLTAERTLTAGSNLALVDAGANSTVTLNVLSNPTFTGLVTANGGLTVQTGDTFTLNGEGFTDLTGDGLTFNVGSLDVTLGTAIDGTEITDNTIEAVDLEVTAAATDNYVLTFDSASGGFTWVDPTTVGATYSFDITDGSTTETINDADTFTFIDGTNVDAVVSATDTLTINVVNNPTFSGLATLNGGLTVEAGDTFTFNNDAFTDLTGTGLTISSGSLQTTLGTAIDNTEITDGTILFADLGQNSCSSSDIIKWNGSAWVCDTDAIGSGTNTFATFDVSSGTDPVADSTTDILTLADGAGITITGDSGTDTLTFAAVLGADIDLASAEVTGILGVTNGGTGSSSAGGARTNLGAAASGANADITSTTALNTITPGAALTVGAIGQNFTLQGNGSSSITSTDSGFTTTVDFVTPTGNSTVSFPNNIGGTICTTAGNCLGGGGGGANTALSNLTSVAINTSLLPGATTIDLGSAAAPFRDLYIGGTATNNFRLTGTATSPRTINIPDAGGTLAVAASGNIALSAGGNISLTGQVPVANGGTGAGTQQAAINALSGLTTNGDLLYFNGTNSTRLGRGTNGQCLAANATTLVWQNCSGTGSTNTLQAAYEAGNTILANNANGDIDLTVSEARNFTVDIAGTGVFEVQDNGSAVLTVIDGGNVGIGTDTPAARLDVRTTAAELLRVDRTGGGAGWIELRENGTLKSYLGFETAAGGGVATSSLGNSTVLRSENALHLISGSSALNGITVATSGNVGIGITSPSDILHVGRDGNIQAIFESTDDNAVQLRLKSENANRRLIALDGGDNVESQIILGDNGQFEFAAATTTTTPFTIQGGAPDDSLWLASTGNVGIGTSTVDARLDVVDNAATTANIIEVTGNSLTTGDALNVTAFNDATSGTVETTGSTIYATPGAASTASYRGLSGVARTTEGDNIDNALAGVYGLAYNQSSSGTANAVYGVLGETWTPTAGGTTTTAAALYAAPNYTAGSGTITNGYGLLVADQTAAANDFGVAIAGADTAALWISSAVDTTDAANGISFGLSRDTNLYRSGANALRTDDRLYVGDRLDVTSSATFESIVTVNNSSTLELDGGVIDFIDGADTATLQSASLSNDRTWTLPDETGTICTTGSVCSGYQASGSYLTGTGSANRIAYWDGASSLTQSANLTYDGTDLALTSGDFVLSTSDTQLRSANANQFLQVQTADGDINLSSIGDVTVNIDSDNNGAHSFSVWQDSTNESGTQILSVSSSATNIALGNLQLNGTIRLTSAGLLQNITGLTSSGTISFTGLASSSTEDTIVVLNGSNQLEYREYSDFLSDNNVINGTGSANRIAYWTDADTLTNSADLTYDGSVFTFNNGTGGSGVTDFSVSSATGNLTTYGNSISFTAGDVTGSEALLTAGNGGSITFTSGDGGASQETGTSGDGGDIIFNVGSQGGGSGSGGSGNAGNFQVNLGSGPGSLFQVDSPSNSTSDFIIFQLLSDVGFANNVKLSVDAEGDLITDGDVQALGNLRVGIGGTPDLTLNGEDTYVEGTLEVDNQVRFDGNVDLGNAAADTITFNGEVDSDIIPDADDTYDLGSSSLRWQDLYLGPASLHVYCSAAECTSARDWSLGVIETDGATEGTLRLGLAGANNITVDTAGLVGIGTDDPDEELTVQGSSFTYAKIESTANASAGVQLVNTVRSWQTRNTTTDGNFVIEDLTGGRTPVVVEAGAPSNSLNIESTGELRLNASQYINFGATAGSGGYGIRDNAGTIEVKNSGGGWAAVGVGAWTSSGGNTYLNTITDNVGIGTSSPATRLEVTGTGANIAATIDAATGFYAIQYFAENGTNKWHYESAPASFGGHFSFVESGVSERLRLDDGGNVLIGGGSNPTQKLEVQGAIQAGQTSGDALFVGNDSKLTDVNVANTLGVYGQQNTDRASIRLGSAGGTLSTAGSTTISVSNSLSIPTADTSLSFGSDVRQMINLWSTSYGIGVQSSTQYYRSGSNFAWYTGGSHNDSAYNNGGGTTLMTLDSTSLTVESDIRFQNNSLIASYASATNIDHIWHNETDNAWVFQSDAPSRDTSTTSDLSRIHAGNAWFQSDQVYIGGSYGLGYGYGLTDHVSIQDNHNQEAATTNGPTITLVNDDGATFNGCKTEITNTGVNGNTHIDTIDYGTGCGAGSVFINWYQGDGLRVGNGAAAGNYGDIYGADLLADGTLYNNDDAAIAVNDYAVCIDLNSNGSYNEVGRCTSLREKKINIQSLSLGLDTARQLRPVSFAWKDSPGFNDFGFIAEEVEAVNPILAEYESSGELSGVRYLHMSALSINAIKELDVIVQNNTSRIAVLESGQLSSLSVSTNAEVQGNLTVQGVTTLESLVVTDTAEIAQLTVERIVSAGNPPTAVLSASTGLGSTHVIDGNDTAGNIKITTGTGVSSGDQVTVTFANPYATNPRIALSAKDANSAAVRYFVETTTNGFVLTFLDTPNNTSTYSFDYIVIQ